MAPSSSSILFEWKEKMGKLLLCIIDQKRYKKLSAVVQYPCVSVCIIISHQQDVDSFRSEEQRRSSAFYNNNKKTIIIKKQPLIYDGLLSHGSFPASNNSRNDSLVRCLVPVSDLTDDVNKKEKFPI